MDGIGRGSSIPSATNIGNTKCLGSKDVCAAKRRNAGVERSRRGRCRGYALMERRLEARFDSREGAQNASPHGVSVYKHARSQGGGAPSSRDWQSLAPAALL